MSTALIVGILIILLVVGVPILQAMLRGLQRRRSLSAEGVAALQAAGLPPAELPRGLTRQAAEAVTSEEIALSDEHPQATITQLDDGGRVIGYRESYRDPRSWGELIDWVLAQTLYRRREHRRVEVELTRYASAQQASQALDSGLPREHGEDGVHIEEIGERRGLHAREWTRSEHGATVQRMLELRFVAGDVLAVVRGDSEPSGALGDEEVERLAAIMRERVQGRLS